MDEAQQLDLAREGQRVDLVEEEGALVRLGGQPGGASAGTGEGPADVAEEFIFEEIGGHGAAVDGDEVGVRASTLFVDAPRVEFLAYAAGLAGGVQGESCRLKPLG